jgi:osmotically-inducible protein OsmY
MTDEKEPPKQKTTRVWSEYAEPSRPHGADAVRQPISAAPTDPPIEQPSDPELEAAVQEAIAADGRLKRGSYSVSSRDGVVTLKGRVPFEYQRELAKACAESCPGVRVLVNQLQVD